MLHADNKRFQVVEGWHHAVATMEKGEVSRFHVTADRAYGADGCKSRDKSYVVPPHAMLIYVFELISYEPVSTSTSRRARR